MSLIVHLMKKDARYLRYELAIWLALVLTQAGLVLSGVDVQTPEAALSTLDNLYVALWVLQLVLGGVFAAQLVQCDSLVSTTAFWRTRPIPRVTLLASKLVIVGVVLLAIPFIVELSTYWHLLWAFASRLSRRPAASRCERCAWLPLWPSQSSPPMSPGLSSRSSSCWSGRPWPYG